MMTKLTLNQARDQLADLGRRVTETGERFLIEGEGKELCALVTAEDLALLERLENEWDLEALRSSKDEPSIPWARVKADLGL